MQVMSTSRALAGLVHMPLAVKTCTSASRAITAKLLIALATASF